MIGIDFVLDGTDNNMDIDLLQNSGNSETDLDPYYISRAVFISIIVVVFLLQSIQFTSQYMRFKRGDKIKILQRYIPAFLIAHLSFIIFNVDEYGHFEIFSLETVQMLRLVTQIIMLEFVFLYAYVLYNSLDFGDGTSTTLKVGKNAAIMLATYVTISLVVFRILSVYSGLPRWTVALEAFNGFVIVFSAAIYMSHARFTLFRRLRKTQISEENLKTAFKKWNKQYIVLFSVLSIWAVYCIIQGALLLRHPFDPVQYESVMTYNSVGATVAGTLAHILVVHVVWEPLVISPKPEDASIDASATISYGSRNE